MNDGNFEQGLVQEALKALGEVAAIRSDLQLRNEGTADLVLEHGDNSASFKVVFRRKLGKQVAAQVATAEATQPRNDSLVITGHVTEAAGKLLREEGIAYLDTAGNCHIAAGGLLLFVEGRKGKTIPERRHRAFQKAGLKVIFALLQAPDLIEEPYRVIAETADVSRGAVGYIARDLEELGYVEGGSARRRLRRKPALAERWATGYAETLRPELAGGRFRFVGEGRARWKNVDLKPGGEWWSGEPAADLMTGHLRPERFTLYARGRASRDTLERLHAIPDSDGPLEVLSTFWTRKLEARVSGEDDGTDAWQFRQARQTASPLLVYADLLASGESRNIELARMIQEQHLTEAAFEARR